MNAIPEEVVGPAARLSDAVTRPFPNSRKVYVQGSRPDLRVGMREILQSPTRSTQGPEPNPPIPVYDTSGPYTDPDCEIDLTRGLPALRARWIEERGDTEVLDGPSSEYGRRRLQDPALAHLRFAHVRPPPACPAGCQRDPAALCAARHRHPRDGIRGHPGELPPAGTA